MLVLEFPATMHQGTQMSKIYTAIGLMSGTSRDGIDLAIITTDGEDLVERERLDVFHQEFTTSDRQVIKKALTQAIDLTDRNQRPGWLATAEQIVTDKHIDFVRSTLNAFAGNPQWGLDSSKIGLIGFHGQTVLHRPDEGLTVQLGDCQELANTVNLPVIGDFRQADLDAGGQGAPLVPIYHQALVRQAGLALPVAVLNVGGVANVTYIGEQGELIAFDTGPGNALINDWVNQHGAGEMDEGGKIAAQGRMKESVLAALLNNSYFSQDPPKSLDRNHFSLEPLAGMSLPSGAMTLTSFTALAVARADFFFPAPPRKWIVCGGGTRNPVLMAELQKRLSGEVLSAEELGWSSDYMEAEAFAYLAVRSLRGLPLTFPGTTGVGKPLTGGVLHKPQG